MQRAGWLSLVGLLTLGCGAKKAAQPGAGGGFAGAGGGGSGGVDAAGVDAEPLSDVRGAGASDAGGARTDGGVVDASTDTPGADVSRPAPDGGTTLTDGGARDAAASPDAVEAVGRCSPQGWCWMNPLPHGNRYASIFAGSASDVWFASSEMGHWDGSQLTFKPTAGMGAAWLVGSSASDVWGVDGYGGIIRYDGQSWKVGQPAQKTLVQDVYASGPNDLWLVGADTQHWDGVRWTTMSSAMSGNGVGGTGPTNVWLASASYGAFRWDGQSWSMVSNKTSLYDIQPVSTTQAWACDGGTNRDLYFLDGASATAQGFFDKDAPCADIWIAPGGTVWAVGGGKVYRKKVAGVWTMVGTGQLAALSTIGGTADEVFVAGGAGLILRARNAGGDTLTWDRLAGGRSAVTHRRIWVGPGVAWTASPTARGLFRWDGQRWQPGWATPDNLAINAVHGTGPGDVWAVGEKGLIAHFDGTDWKIQSTPNQTTLQAVWAASDKNVWAAGDRGRVARFDGQRWQEVPSFLGSTNFRDIWADETGGYAVGMNDSRPILAHLRDGRMFELDAKVSHPTSIWGVPGGPIYVGGGFDTIGPILARYEGKGRTSVDLGGAWTLFPDYNGNTGGLSATSVNAIWGTGASDVWLTGTGNGPGIGSASTYQFNGQTWTHHDLGVYPFFGMLGVSGTPSEVWVVGEADAILRLRR